jgi:hypothetical protein
MDNNILMGSIILSIIGMVVWFHFLVLTILGAMQKIQKMGRRRKCKKNRGSHF